MRQLGDVALRALTLVVLVAGCSSAPAVKTKPTSSTTAAVPTVDEQTGSISGKVLTDELVPLPGAEVGITDLQLTTKTDATGVFTFNSLKPGSYKLIVQALGFEASGRKVDVTAGQVVNVNLTLKAIALPAEPHHTTVERVSLIQFDQEWVGFVAILAGVNHSTVCGQCYHTLILEPGPVQDLVENWWSSTEIGPVNSQVAIWWMYKDTKGGSHNNLVDAYTNRESRMWVDAENLELMKSGATKVNMIVESGLSTASVQQRVNTYNTFAYVAPLPDGFSALPPK
jgi:hypothetical protein